MPLTDFERYGAAATVRLLSKIVSDDWESSDPLFAGVPCVRALVDALREAFLARAAAFLWWDDTTVDPLCIAVPSDEKRLLRRCLAHSTIEKALGGLRREEPGRCQWIVPGQDVAPFEEFVAAKIPSLYEGRGSPGVGIVCLVDRMIRPPLKQVVPRTDVAAIQHVVAFWAARMVHRRALLHWVCDQCMRNPGSADHDTSIESLRTLTRTLRRTLSVSDIVAVAEAIDALERTALTAAVLSEPQRTRGEAGAQRQRSPAVSQFGALPPVLLEVLKDWRCCAPPRWPPACDGCAASAAPKDLAEWAAWRNCTPGEIAKHRPQAKQIAARLLSFLPARARQAVQPALNLLPHGLQCFVLGRDADPWVTERMAFWGSDGPSNEELANAVRSLARVVHFVMGGMPLDDDTIQAMIWLLCEYAHHALGVPEAIDLRAHLGQAARGEPTLHMLRSFYRDHFFHTLEVCFLGHFLLELRIQPDKPLWHFVAESMGLSSAEDGSHRHILRLWYVAALLHDVGYGIDVLESVRKLLVFFKNTPPLNGLLDRLGTDLVQLSKDLEAAGLALYTAADRPGEDHGVIAAWHLEKLLERAAQKDARLDRQDYWPAIRAIAMHNSRKHTVRFSEDPLAFLLVLADTLQEWNRPRLGTGSAPSYILWRLLDQGARNEHLTGPLDAVRLSVLPLPGNGAFRLEHYARPLRFTLTFNDEIHSDAGVFNLWLDASCNLQRLDFAGLPAKFDVEIEYRTPLFLRESGAVREEQFYCLRDAARETHMTFLQRWFPEQKRRDAMTNGAVTWVVEDAPEASQRTETLTLHLRKLSETKPFGGAIEDFRRLLTKWKRFNEDREFAGDYAAPETVQ